MSNIKVLHSSVFQINSPVSYTHLDVYKRQVLLYIPDFFKIFHRLEWKKKIKYEKTGWGGGKNPRYGPWVTVFFSFKKQYYIVYFGIRD